MKHWGKVGWFLFILWGASTMWEIYTRGSGAEFSVWSQWFISVGIPYFVLYLMLVWFIRSTGLNRLPHILDKLEIYLEEKKNQHSKGGN